MLTVMLVLALLFTGAAVVLLLGLPFVLSEPAAPEDRSWRDPAPFLFRLLLPVGRLYSGLQRKLPSGHRAVLERRLNAAGVGYAIVPEEVVVVRWVMAFIGLGLALFVYFAIGSLTPSWVIGLGVLPVLGYFYTDIWLRDQAKKRQHMLSKQFPFFMEILVLCMRAGVTFPSAVQQATGRLPEGPVKEEFIRYLREIRTGTRRREALERLSQRCQMAGVSNFVSAVNQAEDTGAALGSVLSDQAEQRRRERFLEAENQANKAPVKMLFPLIAFLFPITFVIIMFPIAIEMMNSGAGALF